MYKDHIKFAGVEYSSFSRKSMISAVRSDLGTIKTDTIGTVDLNADSEALRLCYSPVVLEQGFPTQR